MDAKGQMLQMIQLFHKKATQNTNKKIMPPKIRIYQSSPICILHD